MKLVNYLFSFVVFFIAIVACKTAQQGSGLDSGASNENLINTYENIDFSYIRLADIQCPTGKQVDYRPVISFPAENDKGWDERQLATNPGRGPRRFNNVIEFNAKMLYNGTDKSFRPYDWYCWSGNEFFNERRNTRKTLNFPPISNETAKKELYLSPSSGNYKFVIIRKGYRSKDFAVFVKSNLIEQAYCKCIEEQNGLSTGAQACRNRLVEQSDQSALANHICSASSDTPPVSEAPSDEVSKKKFCDCYKASTDDNPFITSREAVLACAGQHQYKSDWLCTGMTAPGELCWCLKKKEEGFVPINADNTSECTAKGKESGCTYSVWRLDKPALSEFY